MSLEKWAEYGWLKAEPTSRDEVLGLLSIIERDLKDARISAVSEDRRFEAAFNAARTAANLALRACGYRTSTQPGHHVRTLESLEFTIQAEFHLIQKLKLFSRKRNASSYDWAGSISKHELTSVIETAAALQDSVLAWLRKNHPELL